MKSQTTVSCHQSSTTTSILCAALIWACIVETAIAETVHSRFNVDRDQRVQLVGRWPSLRELLPELCRAAGVRLDGLPIVDTPVVVTIDGQPFSDVIARLLRRESFVVGTTTSVATGNREVEWVRVIGGDRAPSRSADFEQPESSMSRPAIASTAGRSMSESNFGMDETAQMVASTAIEMLGRGRGEFLRDIVGTDVDSLVEIARSFPGAQSMIQAVRASIDDPELQRVADQVADRLLEPN